LQESTTAQFLLLRTVLHSRKRIREVELWRGKFGGEGAERFEIVALATTSAKAINTLTSTFQLQDSPQASTFDHSK